MENKKEKKISKIKEELARLRAKLNANPQGHPHLKSKPKIQTKPKPAPNPKPVSKPKAAPKPKTESKSKDKPVDKTSKPIVIDGTDHIAGRLSSNVAKLLLQGNRVTVVNSEKIMMSGRTVSYTHLTLPTTPYV